MEHGLLGYRHSAQANGKLKLRLVILDLRSNGKYASTARRITTPAKQDYPMIKLFPLGVVLAAAFGILLPETLAGFSSWIVPLLMIVMLGMGLTLKPTDFLDLKDYGRAVAAGITLQFTVMPLMAVSISAAFSLNNELTIGMILVGSVAGGTASNVMTLLAKGNVALSVSMTALSTLASIVMTPLLMTWLASSQVEVPAIAMLASLCKIILLPVSVGVLANVYGARWVMRIKPALPVIAALVILLIIAIIIALNADRLSTVAMSLMLATLVHNLSGLALGYSVARLLRFNSVVCRTIAIEVGMQNSGLATALAIKFFTPASALPGAIFSIWLNVTGAIFAAFCNRKQPETESPSTPP
jgi:bile acid:Na+ symporter, BASS family